MIERLPEDRRPTAALSRFDSLPDSAMVPVTTVAAISSEGVSTIWRKAKTNPDLKPVVLGPRCTRFKVGGVRKYLAGQGNGVAA